jgi:hypothetical protein
MFYNDPQIGDGGKVRTAKKKFIAHAKKQLRVQE